MKKEEIEKLVEDIKAGELEILNKVTLLSKTNEEIDQINTAVMAQITSEINKDGKPAFSNQLKRDAEFQDRVRKEKIYIEKQKDIKDKEYEIAVLRIELQNAKYLFREFEILSRYGTD